MVSKVRPVVLIILDGWGYSVSSQANAIYAARKPVWDRLWQDYPHTLLDGSGSSVGLPNDQMGNSEVGHLSLGAGRVVYQEFTRINRAINSGMFYSNHVLTQAVDSAVGRGGAVHVLGLLSPGGVHSHEEHIHAMVRLAAQRGAQHIYVHAFLDGRDTPPRSAESSLSALEQFLATLGRGRIASLCGRYFAMDRDQRWSRIQAAYELIVDGRGVYQANSALDALSMAYARNESDEFVQATTVVPPGTLPVRVEDGDAVIFMNYRSDRARQLTHAFLDSEMTAFARARRPALASFITLTEYSQEFTCPVAFPPERLHNVFGEYIAERGLRQFRVAETEKYAHVTFFFNGGREAPFPGEDRVLVPSPKVATYDLQPQMSAAQVTDHLVAAMTSQCYDAIICNYANPDMVGHTGNFSATVEAIETIDHCLGRVMAALGQTGGEMLITADHGNAERMRDESTGQAHTAHTCNLVPLIYVGRPAHFTGEGILADVAPTLLTLMGLAVPSEMTGRSLIIAGPAPPA